MHVAQNVQAMNVSCEIEHVKDQCAAEGILHVATNRGCDLIVMSTHGRRGFSRMLLGSQANKFVAPAPYRSRMTVSWTLMRKAASAGRNSRHSMIDLHHPARLNQPPATPQRTVRGRSEPKSALCRKISATNASSDEAAFGISLLTLGGPNGAFLSEPSFRRCPMSAFGER
ncbi:MAG: universal stress protein [Hyphomicrobiaceae bacterium]